MGSFIKRLLLCVYLCLLVARPLSTAQIEPNTEQHDAVQQFMLRLAAVQAKIAAEKAQGQGTASNKTAAAVIPTNMHPTTPSTTNATTSNQQHAQSHLVVNQRDSITNTATSTTSPGRASSGNPTATTTHTAGASPLTTTNANNAGSNASAASTTHSSSNITVLRMNKPQLAASTTTTTMHKASAIVEQPSTLPKAPATLPSATFTAATSTNSTTPSSASGLSPSISNKTSAITTESIGTTQNKPQAQTQGSPGRTMAPTNATTKLNTTSATSSISSQAASTSQATSTIPAATTTTTTTTTVTRAATTAVPVNAILSNFTSISPSPAPLPSPSPSPLPSPSPSPSPSPLPSPLPSSSPSPAPSPPPSSSPSPSPYAFPSPFPFPSPSSSSTSSSPVRAAPPPPPENLPVRFCEPQPNHPFAFFHQRNTVGSWLIDAINHAAHERNYTSAIACHTAACHVQNTLRDWKHQVLAGPLTWGYVFSNLPTTSSPPQFTCVTVFESPADRIRKCFFASWAETIDVTELTTAQIQKVVSRARSREGYGCVNEPVRVFSGFTSEMDINNLYADPDLAKALIRKAKEHLSSCIVLMQDDLNHPRTSTMLRYWAPWLPVNIFTLPQPEPEPPLMSQRLTPDQMQALRDVAWPEFELYDWAQLRYARQLRHMHQYAATQCVR